MICVYQNPPNPTRVCWLFRWEQTVINDQFIENSKAVFYMSTGSPDLVVEFATK